MEGESLCAAVVFRPLLIDQKYCQMIDLLLRLCTEEIAVNESSYQWGVDDLSVLPRPFHYAAGLRQDGDIPPFVALEMIHSHIEADTHLMPFAAFPTVSSATPSTSVAEAAPVQSIVIPEEDYKLLHAAAKASDCTASAWVGAVLTILLYELNTVEDAKTIRFPLQPVDARRYVPEGSPNFFGVAIGGGNVDIKDLKAVKSALSDLKKEGPIPGSFWTVSKEYKQGLEKLKVRAARNAFIEP